MNEEMESFAILCVEYFCSYFCRPMLVDSFRSEKISGDVRQDLTLEEPASSEVADLPDQPNEPMNNTEDARHIMNLENQVKILKKQVLSAHAQAEKCSTLENQVKSLEDKFSMYVSKIEGLNRVVDMK
jgi:predicted RNase H-like nuclease (RuvC/YqgF family)